LVALGVVLLFVDLHVRTYGKSAPGERPQARAAGRVLELPVFDPGVHYGSVYLWYDTRTPRERPGGYSTTAPRRARAVARRLERLNCGDWSDATDRYVRRLDVATIDLHLGLFVRNSAVPDRAYFAWRGLVQHGWSVIDARGSVWTLERRREGLPVALGPEPQRDHPVFCQGWYGDVGSGRFMSEVHAPLWVYGDGALTLRFAPSPLPRRIAVDGRAQRGLRLRLGKRAWHLVTVDVPRLVAGPEGKKVGLRLVGASTSPAPSAAQAAQRARERGRGDGR
jgi:hypothetical protein